MAKINNTKANVVALLNQKVDLAHELAKIAKDRGDEKEYDACIREAIAYGSAIDLLTNKEYFNDIYKIMNDIQ